MSTDISIKPLLPLVRAKSRAITRYSLPAFVIFVALLYGYLILRINTLTSMEPSPEAVTQRVNAAKAPNIDEDIVRQLESLEDNSVSVQALFDEARSNPFQ